MSTSLDNVYPSVFGSSPKQICDLDSKLGMNRDKVDSSKSRYWSDGDLDKFLGVRWTPSGSEKLDVIARVWIQSLVDKENTHRLPDLTAYLALHYPRLDNSSQPALALLDDYVTSVVDRPGFSSCHEIDFNSGLKSTRFTTDPDYVRFRAWYDELLQNQRVAFACYLALCFVQLSSKTVEETLTYMRNHVMHDFQRYCGVPANNLTWIPFRSVSYLKSYFQPCSQLLVTVLRPYLLLREQLMTDASHRTLLDSLDNVLRNQGKGLELVEAFRTVVGDMDITEDQLLSALPRDSSDQLDKFIRKYGLTRDGTWLWAQHFSPDYFSEFSVRQNRKAFRLLSAVSGEENLNRLDDEEKNWVNEIWCKYGSRRERAQIACHEDFWDGARRLDYA